MQIELTEAQSRAIEQSGEASPSVMDPRTRKAYVLLSADVFEQIKSLVHDDDSISDAYRGQIDSAMKAGWEDPLMDEYNDYDAHRKP